MTLPKTITLTEYQPQYISTDLLSDEAGLLLYQNYQGKIEVEFPSPKTVGQWRLYPQGWVGHIPLSPELTFELKPKVNLENLFGMLEYAYNLKSFEFLAGTIKTDSLTDFYERLANVLAKRVLERGRKGFYRAYLPQMEQLAYVRGRLDMGRTSQKPWQVQPHCHFEEHTADIEDNQLLAWALQRVARSGLCSARVLPTVRRAYRALQGFVTPAPHPSAACLNRLYNRLNQDYQPMHALCRFFLEQSGPSHQRGDERMLPFLVDMARLYERFVAEWLRENLPSQFYLKAQAHYPIDQENRINFVIDLVIYDRDTGQAICVLDTKYKAPISHSTTDIAQAVAYAQASSCQEAILIYPTPLPNPLDQAVGTTRVRSLAFSLDGDLDQAGQTFLGQLADLIPAKT